MAGRASVALEIYKHLHDCENCSQHFSDLVERLENAEQSEAVLISVIDIVKKSKTKLADEIRLEVFGPPEPSAAVSDMVQG